METFRLQTIGELKIMKNFYVFSTTCYLVESESQESLEQGKIVSFEQINNFEFAEIRDNIEAIEEIQDLPDLPF